MALVVVTGSASGIGKAVAAALALRGDKVITVDRAAADVNGDLATPAGRAAVLEEVIQRCGGVLDGVVACAGIGSGSGATIVGVNFFGAADFVTALQPLLALAEAPRAVVISSEALLLKSDPRTVEACLAGDHAAAAAAADAAEQLAYPSSKLALSQWVKREAVGAEWAGRNILLNAVAPGVVQTPMVQSLLDTKEGMDFLNASTPMRLGRPAQPAEIAALAAFLVSKENSFIVGQTIYCDGGAEATLRPAHV